jgi:hypothetical protein
MLQHGSVPVLMRGAHVCGSGTLGQGGGIPPVEQILAVVHGKYDRLKQYAGWKELLDSYVQSKRNSTSWRGAFKFPSTTPEDYSQWFDTLSFDETERLLNAAVRWSNKHSADFGVAAVTAAAVGGLMPVEQILDVVSGAYSRLKQYPDWKQLLDSYVTHNKDNKVWRSMFQFPETWPGDYSNWFNHLGRRETESLLTQALRWSNKHSADFGVAAVTPAPDGSKTPTSVASGMLMRN